MSMAKRAARKRAYVVKRWLPGVTDGETDITFTANIQSPEINAIEIIPAP